MKKILLPLLVCAIGLLSACADNSLHDSYAAYRNQSASQLYFSSKKDLKTGHEDQAVKKLEALSTLYPFGAYSEEGLITLVYAYYKNDDVDEAMATVDRYLQLHPRGHYTDYAYYMKGTLAFNEGFSWLQRRLGVNAAPRDIRNLKQAYLAFNELLTSYPQSIYVPDAIKRMCYIRNLFAEKELGIAQFYYERRAYVAAANRASNVVVHYDRSPSVIPALAIMVKSYRTLGLTKEADNTLKIFQASYPNSPVLANLMRN